MRTMTLSRGGARTRSSLAAGLLAVVLAVPACGSNDATGDNTGGGMSSPTATATAKADEGESTISIEGFQFGAPLTVQAGQQIEVYNKDSAPHTVTADDGASFDVRVAAGEEAVLTAPNTPGTYAFHCTVHPNMQGSLVVQ